MTESSQYARNDKGFQQDTKTGHWRLQEQKQITRVSNSRQPFVPGAALYNMLTYPTAVWAGNQYFVKLCGDTGSQNNTYFYPAHYDTLNFAPRLQQPLDAEAYPEMPKQIGKELAPDFSKCCVDRGLGEFGTLL